MAIWAIVDYYDKRPISPRAYTAAVTKIEAINNFKGKWFKKVPGVPSPRELMNNIEVSQWDVVEVPPRAKQEQSPAPITPKPAQLDLGI